MEEASSCLPVAGTALSLTPSLSAPTLTPTLTLTSTFTPDPVPDPSRSVDSLHQLEVKSVSVDGLMSG